MWGMADNGAARAGALVALYSYSWVSEGLPSPPDFASSPALNLPRPSIDRPVMVVYEHRDEETPKLLPTSALIASGHGLVARVRGLLLRALFTFPPDIGRMPLQWDSLSSY
jgi:hypothetical protein